MPATISRCCARDAWVTRDRVLALFLGSNNRQLRARRRARAAHAARRRAAAGRRRADRLRPQERSVDPRVGVRRSDRRDGRLQQEPARAHEPRAGCRLRPGRVPLPCALDDARGAVLSYLVADVAQRVRIPLAGLTVELAAGDMIHTESSLQVQPRRDHSARRNAAVYAERTTYSDTAGRYGALPTHRRLTALRHRAASGASPGRKSRSRLRRRRH